MSICVIYLSSFEFETVQLKVQVISISRYKNLSCEHYMYKAWSDCTDVQAGLALYSYQIITTTVFSRLRIEFTKNSKRFKADQWHLTNKSREKG
jgi:hypothetical protein